MQFSSIKDFVGPDGKLRKQGLISAVRLSIASQHDARRLYDLIARSTDDVDIKKIMSDVRDEEKVHIGQFQRLLDRIDFNSHQMQRQGRQQARQKTRKQQQPQIDRMRQLRGIQQ